MATTKNALSGKAKFDLLTYVQANYAAANLHDKEFAEKATAELGFTVTGGNVAGAREVFGITSTRDLQRATPKGDIEEALRIIGDLQRRLAALEQRVEVYLTGCTLPGCPQVKK